MYDNNYSVYGLKTEDVETTHDKLSAILQTEFEGVNSDQWGLYFMSQGATPQIYIYTNLFPITAPDEEGEERWSAENHKKYPILVSVYDARDMDFYDKLFTNDPEFQGVLIERDIDEDDE